MNYGVNISWWDIDDTRKYYRTDPVSPFDPIPVSNERIHYVAQPGDTLALIADLFRVSSNSLLEDNPSLRTNSIRPGDNVWIPKN